MKAVPPRKFNLPEDKLRAEETKKDCCYRDDDGDDEEENESLALLEPTSDELEERREYSRGLRSLSDGELSAEAECAVLRLMFLRRELDSLLGDPSVESMVLKEILLEDQVEKLRLVRAELGRRDRISEKELLEMMLARRAYDEKLAALLRLGVIT